MGASFTVQCPVCKTVGVYELPPAARQATELEEWGPLACFFTPGCPGHIWPEFAN